jgi:hypothetical protein
MARRRASEVDGYGKLRTRAHWKPADAASVLSDWSRSGESMAAFAQRTGLRLSRVQRWRDRLSPEPSRASPSSVRLLPAVLRVPPVLLNDALTSGVPVCVVADGVRIEVADVQGTDPQWVAALVSSLRAVRT